MSRNFPNFDKGKSFKFLEGHELRTALMLLPSQMLDCFAGMENILSAFDSTTAIDNLGLVL